MNSTVEVRETIPVHKLNLLMLAWLDAEALAAEGHPEVGYMALRDGQRQAREGLSDEPWAAAFLERWRAAMARFCEKHPLAGEGTPSSR